MQCFLGKRPKICNLINISLKYAAFYAFLAIYATAIFKKTYAKNIDFSKKYDTLKKNKGHETKG